MSNQIPEPCNTLEYYQYAQIVRLDALIHQVSSIVELLAKQSGVATEHNTVEEEVIAPSEPVKKTRKKKGE